MVGLQEKGDYRLVQTFQVICGQQVDATTSTYKIKADGTYKGRLVVQGRSQTTLCYLQSIIFRWYWQSLE